MKKSIALFMTFVFVFVLIAPTTFAAQLPKKIDYPRTKEIYLKSKSNQGDISIQAGTLISMETDLYLSNGNVHSYGITMTSQPCPFVGVTNYQYEDGVQVNFAEDNQSGTYSYAYAGSTPYDSSSDYVSLSVHKVVDPYGQEIVDYTADSNLEEGA